LVPEVSEQQPQRVRSGTGSGVIDEIDALLAGRDREPEQVTAAVGEELATISLSGSMTAATLVRVGHKGADLIAPGNTIASFDAALDAGVDMIEFDVLQTRTRIVLAHDFADVASRSPLTLDEGLAYLASPRYAQVGFLVDLKLPGYELEVLEGIREHGLVDRALICTQYRESLAVVREAEPAVRVSWTVPKVQRDPFRSWATRIPAYAGLQAMRVALPGQAADAIRARRCDALTAHWRLVTPRLVRRVREAGGELYVWTVDELAQIRALEALGVTGVITNDPRLFAALA
jgi:glycerophosphoryl diester phosphodiesterase